MGSVVASRARYILLPLLASACFSDPPAEQGSSSGGPETEAGSTTNTASGPTTPTASSTGTESEGGSATTEPSTGPSSTTTALPTGTSGSSTGVPEPFCGDGNVDPGEDCDADDLENAVCNDCLFACVEGFTDCDGDPLTGCEADLQVDGANCAVCGRACFSDSCSEAVCAAQNALALMLGGGDPTNSIVRQGDILVVAESFFGAIRGVRISDQTTSIVVPSAETGNRSSLAAAQGNVYFNADGLYEVPADGSAKLSLVVPAAGMGGVATNGNDVYFFDDDGNGSTSTLRRWTIGSDPATTVDVVVGTDGTLNQLVIAGDRLVWDSLRDDGDLESASFDGATPATLALSVWPPSAGPGRRIRGQGNFVYYPGNDDDSATPPTPEGLRRYNVVTGLDTEMVPLQIADGFRDFAVHEDSLYLVMADGVAAFDVDGTALGSVYTDAPPPIAAIYADDELVAFGAGDGSQAWSLLITNPL